MTVQKNFLLEGLDFIKLHFLQKPNWKKTLWDQADISVCSGQCEHPQDSSQGTLSPPCSSYFPQLLSHHN